MTLQFFNKGQPVEVDEMHGTNDDFRRVGAASTASSSVTPYARIKTPKRLGILWLMMILSGAAKAKPRHIPILGADLGNVEEKP